MLPNSPGDSSSQASPWSMPRSLGFCSTNLYPELMKLRLKRRVKVFSPCIMSHCSFRLRTGLTVQLIQWKDFYCWESWCWLFTTWLFLFIFANKHADALHTSINKASVCSPSLNIQFHLSHSQLTGKLFLFYSYSWSKCAIGLSEHFQSSLLLTGAREVQLDGVFNRTRSSSEVICKTTGTWNSKLNDE